MSGIIKIEIVESVEELHQLLHRSENREVKERIQTLYWLKTQQVATTEATAALGGKHRTTVSRWLSSYRRGGLKRLLAKGKSTGRTRTLTPAIEQKLRQELKDEEGFSSYKEIQTWLKAVHDVEMSYSGVHQLVHYRLQGKLNVPRPVHNQQETGVGKAFQKN